MAKKKRIYGKCCQSLGLKEIATGIQHILSTCVMLRNPLAVNFGGLGRKEILRDSILEIQLMFGPLGSAIQNSLLITRKHSIECEYDTVTRKQRHIGCHSLSLANFQAELVRNSDIQPVRLT
ncbi:hypothetical protein NPIL_212491 [Nephila pilipes]|uniref:Uncharacterized protein n=1 Tax=Nephila pilipes TaxID=299642 RepID=A0A8X6QPY8_NEPPI|nr:hypothetical protein NPIL_212491 [Nephila pilipes]